MKLLLSLILITNSMGYKDFQNLIGEHISVAKLVLEDDFKNDVFGNHFYYTPLGVDKLFYGISYNSLTIITDEQDNVKEISIHFYEVINKSFYDLFTADYGDPSTIQVVYEKKIISEGKSTSNESFVQDLKQSVIQTREGEFNENPLFMIWDMDGYQIKIFLRHDQNTSEVIFRIPEKEI